MKSRKQHQRSRPGYRIALIFVPMLLMTSCTFNLSPVSQATPTPGAPFVTSSQNYPLAMVTFIAEAPVEAPAGNLVLEMLDEVTGLALNPQRYAMTANESGAYTVDIPVPVGSVIKYRYLRQGQSLAVEYTAAGNQVRYRMALIDGPMVIQDRIAAWTDFRYNGSTGRIKGQVVTPSNNIPVPGALVICAGERTLTASDGSFLLDGLMPGTHNLVVYSLDGSYQPFQQGARIAENASTPAFITVNPAQKVKVTFIVQIPESNIEGLPVRMVGNIASLGNTFADLDGGLSVVASRAPLMNMVSKGVYSLTLELPVGLDLRYKYTLGDGFWNAEHTVDGYFRVRQLIVPDSDLTQTDVVDTWQEGKTAPIVFTVTVPENTPSQDLISIQFNPFIWTTPLPMWPLGGNRWVYVLYSPLDLVKNAGFRFCRNDQCGSADDLTTQGLSAVGQPFTSDPQEQSFDYVIQQWAWWNTSLEPTTIIAPEIAPRDGFIKGVEFSSRYSPTWQPYLHLGMDNARESGADWLLLTPSWHYTNLNPPAIEPIPGADPLWQDTIQTIQDAQQKGFNVGVFPRLAESQPETAWQTPVNDINWWSAWFERYRVFILNYADMAEQTGVPLLLVGGDDVLPALPGGFSRSGQPSGVPAGAGDIWVGLLDEIRSRYHGQVAWALPYPQGLDTVPEFLDRFDLIYVLFSAPLTDSGKDDEGSLQLAFGELLDRDLLPIYENYNLPMVIGLDYPSADGAATACIRSTIGDCIDFDRFDQPLANIPEISVDLVEQANIYGAAFNAVYPRDWISGIVSRGYYPVAALQDKSSSVHGKPASDILWYWFTRLNNP